MMADAQLTDGNMRAKVYSKIKKINGHLVGGAGNLEEVILFQQWYANPNSKPPNLSSRGFEGLAVTPEGDIFTYQRRLVPMKVEEKFYACGSGFAFAMGAMEAGASMERAMEIACKRDSNTGIEIVKIELDRRKKSTKKKASKRR
jgi:ATP-dependent protease HslVU (ClpYQ) peptidase subunit